MKIKVTYLLLDFDGVLSLYLSQVNPNSPVYQRTLNTIKKNEQANFELFAKTIFEVMDDCIQSSCKNKDLVVLAVGSARQTRQHDHYASAHNHHNGLCFTLFAELAEKRGWQFNRLLLPDCPSQEPYTFGALGRTMGPLEKDANGRYFFKEDLFSDCFFWSANRSLMQKGKEALFRVHLAYIRHHYPSSHYDVTLEFWDDQEYHIQTCRAHAEKHPHTLPEKLITRHFNWARVLHAFDGDPNKFRLWLQKNIDSHVQVRNHTQKYATLSLFSRSMPVAIPYSWMTLGLSVFLFSCFLMNKSDTQVDFKPKSMY